MFDFLHGRASFFPEIAAMIRIVTIQFPIHGIINDVLSRQTHFVFVANDAIKKASLPDTITSRSPLIVDGFG